ncbi:helix-turn-helix domain-containing protein [Nocardioides lianchengensis]|uniref:helix-turn-helix domain-containing protein n=1 Tax=Nocardioides lianchengensis TaxID=1045774 RepID=UPI000B83524D|nr:helix-turn-helix domain-containing protein [Nocardioides lianchengensis]NYG09639.1 excisionase family DNA binding protein [Nocardioides lianchengensis]
MIVGNDGPAVVISARTAAWLERNANLSALRVRVRGTDPETSAHLEQIRYAALSWRGSATGTEAATEAEPASESDMWLSTVEAADLAGITSRAIRKAIAEGRLASVEVGGRHRISREDLEHYKAARAA